MPAVSQLGTVRSLSRRSILKRGGVALGAALGGCRGFSDSADSGTDSPTPSERTGTECQDSSSEASWETAGSWDLDVVVTNDDPVAYTVTAAIFHMGTDPCHHAETAPCEMPEKSETAFERTFDLAAGGSRTISELTVELWEGWIDDYTVRVRIETADRMASDSVFGYETGANEPVGSDEYDRADFHVCDGADRTIESTIADGTPNRTG